MQEFEIGPDGIVPHMETLPSFREDLGRGEEKRKLKALLVIVKWAFSVGGFSSLKMLAYGDFSHRGRFEDRNLLIIRVGLHPHGFRTACKDDLQKLESVYTDNMGFLDACSVYPIVDD